MQTRATAVGSTARAGGGRYVNSNASSVAQFRPRSMQQPCRNDLLPASRRRRRPGRSPRCSQGRCRGDRRTLGYRRSGQLRAAARLGERPQSPAGDAPFSEFVAEFDGLLGVLGLVGRTKHVHRRRTDMRRVLSSKPAIVSPPVLTGPPPSTATRKPRRLRYAASPITRRRSLSPHQRREPAPFAR